MAAPYHQPATAARPKGHFVSDNLMTAARRRLCKAVRVKDELCMQEYGGSIDLSDSREGPLLCTYRWLWKPEKGAVEHAVRVEFQNQDLLTGMDGVAYELYRIVVVNSSVRMDLDGRPPEANAFATKVRGNVVTITWRTEAEDA